VSLIVDGQPDVSSEAELEGFPLLMPVVNIHTIGAGGGSLAYAEAGGLRVGPESAGADPGPACYGRGGERATVTDANLLLGRVDEASFAGGRMALDVDAARRAVATLGEELGLDATDLAEGICDVANAKMAQAIRTLTVEKGIAPRDFALVACGGAGPMHAAFLARELGIAEVLVPRFPGAFSAWGMLESEVRKDASRAYYVPLAELDRTRLAELLETLETEGYASLADEGIGRDAGRVEHALDLRYAGQEYSLTVPLESAREPLADDFAAALSGRFDEAHDRRFGHANPGAPIEVVVVRSTALGDKGRAEPVELPAGKPSHESSVRRVTFGREVHDAVTAWRDELPRGAELTGPAVISEQTATTVVPPGTRAVVDRFGTLVLTLDEEA
jgi:N-methylhydantoinase A